MMKPRWLIVVLSLIGLLTTVGTAQAQQCGELALNAMIRIADRSDAARETAYRAFERLSEVPSEGARRGADRLFDGMGDSAIETGLRELLERRTQEQATAIFEFIDGATAGASAGVRRASLFGAIEGVAAGETIARLIASSGLTAQGKTAVFEALESLGAMPLTGAPILAKKAAEEVAAGAQNFGHTFEIQANAALALRTADYGPLTGVAVDSTSALNKIDSRTGSHAFQMKSKADPTAVFTGDEFSLADLDLFIAQAGGRTPVLVLSNPAEAVARSQWEARGIQVLILPLVR